MYSRIARLLCVALALCTLPYASAANAKSKPSESPARSKTEKIDLNTASASTLEQLPGVGPATAQAIIAARPFKSVDDLERVPGIGPAKMADLRGQVRVSRVSSSAATKSKGDEHKSERAKEVSRSKSATEHTTARPPVNPEVPPVIARTDRPVVSRQDRPLEPTGLPNSSRHSTPAASASSDLINLNTATKEQLESLPEIGPVKAQAIIENRPYRSIEDVMRVKGIKQGTFDVIRDKITVR